jgi:hypothetical protein
MDGGVIGRWVAMVVSCFCGGEKLESERGRRNKVAGNLHFPQPQSNFLANRYVTFFSL